MICNPHIIKLPLVKIRLVTACSQLTILIITAPPENTIIINIITIIGSDPLSDIIVFNTKRTGSLQFLCLLYVNCWQILFLYLSCFFRCHHFREVFLCFLRRNHTFLCEQYQCCNDTQLHCQRCKLPSGLTSFQNMPDPALDVTFIEAHRCREDPACSRVDRHV